MKSEQNDADGLFQPRNTMKYCRGLVWALQHKDKSTFLNKSQRGIFYLSNLLYDVFSVFGQNMKEALM